MNQRETDLQPLSKAIGKTLSSYTQAINLQNKTRGNLFQQKTKAKCLTDLPYDTAGVAPSDYLVNCFHYIHLNPLKANLVRRLEDWPHSSWLDYSGLRNDGLINKERMIGILGSSVVTSGNYDFSGSSLNEIW